MDTNDFRPTGFDPPPGVDTNRFHIGYISDGYVIPHDKDRDGAISLAEAVKSIRPDIVAINGGYTISDSLAITKAADAGGNQDGKATAAEYTAALRKFDVGGGGGVAGDGYLDGAEKDALDKSGLVPVVRK